MDRRRGLSIDSTAVTARRPAAGGKGGAEPSLGPCHRAHGIEDLRRIATRDDGLATNFRAAVGLAATVCYLTYSRRYRRWRRTVDADGLDFRQVFTASLLNGLLTEPGAIPARSALNIPAASQ